MNELNVTPMLDLCFCLLIIFMIATPVLEQTTAVNLPKAEKGAGKTPDTKVQYRIVSIDRNGAYAIGARVRVVNTGTPANYMEGSITALTAK